MGLLQRCEQGVQFVARLPHRDVRLETGHGQMPHRAVSGQQFVPGASRMCGAIANGIHMSAPVTVEP